METAIFTSMITSLLVHNASKSFIGVLLSILSILISMYQKEIRDFLEKLFRLSEGTQFSITSRVSIRNNSFWSVSYPKSWLAINKSIQDFVLEHSKDLVYEVFEYEHGCYSNPDKDNVVFFVFEGRFNLAPGIWVKTSKTKEHGEKDYVYEHLTITLITENRNFAVIKTFVEKSIKIFEEDMINSLKTQTVFVFDRVSDDDDKIIYKEIPFETNKSFDNIFFDDKRKIIDILDRFMKHKNDYDRLGIPHTLGFLFHGEAGTAKTSCAKCIAKHTKRHVIIVPMKRIKSIDTLRRIFFDKEINNVLIPNKNRLYIFEEIDCGSWSKVVRTRSDIDSQNEHKPTNAPQNKEMLAELIAVLKPEDDNKTCKKRHIISSSTTSSNMSNTQVESDLNLGEFLELLDGMVEIPGRMMIMTSNHPDVLDKALIRPGRIDHIVEFKRMSIDSIDNLYKLWFGVNIPSNIRECMVDRMFTQAEIGNIFAMRNFDVIHEKLKATPTKTT